MLTPERLQRQKRNRAPGERFGFRTGSRGRGSGSTGAATRSGEASEPSGRRMPSAARIAASLMKRLARRVAEMPQAQRSDLTSRARGLIQFLGDLPDQQEQRLSSSSPFDARMRALAALREAP